MSAITRQAPSGAPRASFVVPALIAAAVLGLSTMLLAIGARSPYTHSNLLRGYDTRYERTEQIRVGDVQPYAGIGDAGGATAADPSARGARLFVTKGCASCHALDARGSVGPSIVGADAAMIAKRVRKGPGGMPRYDTAGLTDDEIAAISAYLGSLGSEQRK